MRKFKRFALYLFGMILLAFVLSSMFLLNNASIQTTGQLKTGEISKGIRIVRSDSGIPLIEADNEDDLMFAQGFVTAQDRLLQMMMYKFVFSGRLSELVGENALEIDRYMRMMNFANSVKQSYAEFDPQMQQALMQYAKGVNFFIAQGHKPILMRLMGMPQEAWYPYDNLLVAKAIAWDMNKLWSKKMANAGIELFKGPGSVNYYYPSRRLGIPSCSTQDLKRQKLPMNAEKTEFSKDPKVPKDVIDAMIDFAMLNERVVRLMGGPDIAMPGSNAWAISSTRSGTMQPILASDPHLALSSPNVFHLVHLKSPTVDIIGGAIPGSPGVIIGRNAAVSWGFTNGQVDQSQMYYAEKMPKYRIRNEEIKVKGEKSVTVEFYETDAGVLVSDPEKGPFILFSWEGRSEHDTSLQSIYYLNKSTNLKQAREALSYHVSPPISAILADKYGNIAYQLVGKVGKRYFDGHVPVPLTEAFRVKEYIPYEEMPRSVNPESGVVFSTNNNVVSDHYPYRMSAFGFDNGRIGRLIDLLSAKPVLSVEDNRAIQLDVKDSEWESMKLFLTLSDLSGDTKLAYERLMQWDGFATTDSVGATLFSMWLIELSQAIYNVENEGLPSWAKIDFDKHFVIQVLKQDRVKPYGFESAQEMKSLTFARAVTRLKETLGPDVENWHWGRMHQALFVNNIANKIPGLKQIYNRKIPMPGSRETINCMRWNVLFTPFEFKQGPSLRMLVDMAEGDALIAAPMGASENPFTDRFDNMLKQWVDGQYEQMLQSPKIHVDDQVLNLMPKLN